MRWALIVFAVLGLAIFLLFRDENLKPADDLMPQRPVIAWDDNNGWKKMLEWGERLQAPDKEAQRLVSEAIEMKLDPEKDSLRGTALNDADLSELEALASMSQWGNRIRTEITAPEDPTTRIVRSASHGLNGNSLLAIEEGSFATLIRSLRLSAALQRKHISTGTSLLNFLTGVFWFSNDLVARALVRMDLQDADLAGLDQLLDSDPSTAEDYREAMRHEFRVLWNFLLDAKDATRGEAKGLIRYYYQKNRTLNLLAREFRSHITLALTAPYETIAALTSEREERQQRLSRWRTPNLLGENIVANVLVLGTMELPIRCRTAVRRSLRVIIALHRYHKSHGTLPATLDELVPAFLPAVPQDPFDFQPLRWDAVKRSVYSIGSDGKNQPPDFEGDTNPSGWRALTSAGKAAPGARFRTKADGPDFTPGTKPPGKSAPKAKPAPAKP